MAMQSSTSAQDKPLYRYRPITHSDEIRLLQLHAKADPNSQHISCEIHHVRLGMSPPPYHALSYVWGSSDKDLTISCENGKTYVPITKSLHAALRAMGDPDSAYNLKDGTMQNLSKPEKSPLYWADGICINQDDIEERSQQVMLMGDIYRKAHRVITYISEGNEQQWTGILLGVSLQQYVHKRYPYPPDPRITELDSLQELGFPHKSDPRWRYLREVLQLPWSSRMWIVQETLLNPTIVMKCGLLEIPWSVLGEMSVLASRGYIPFLAITDKVSPHVGLPASVPAHMDIMTRLRQQAMKGDQTFSSLRLLLGQCQHLKSTDPRDKVYALANIAADWAVLGVVPDYRCAVEELYTDVTLRIIQQEKLLTVLAHVYTGKALTNLPSWVPDWSISEAETCLPISGEVKENGIYAASNKTSARIVYNEASRVLSVAGAFIDNIDFVTDIIGSSQFRRKPEWFEDMLKTVQAVSPKDLELGGSTSPMEALWRTLIANFAAMEELKLDVEAPAWYSSYFEAFVRLQGGLAAMEKGLNFAITQTEYARAIAFDRALTQRVSHRSLCRTKRGFLGLVPAGTQKGDDVCIFLGGRTPYIVKISGGTTRFAGEAYIHGLMKGQGMRQVQAELEIIEINA